MAEQLNFLKKEEVASAERFPMRQIVNEKPDVENQTETQTLSPAECAALAVITRNDTPSFPCVTGLESADYLKAIKLVDAAAYSVNDLKRAPQTDLLTLALRILVESPDLDRLAGRPWESKELRELEHRFDADVKKVGTHSWNHWKDQLFINS